MMILGSPDAPQVRGYLGAGITFQWATEARFCMFVPFPLTSPDPRDSERTAPLCSLGFSQDLIKVGSPHISPNKLSQDSCSEHEASVRNKKPVTGLSASCKPTRIPQVSCGVLSQLHR